MVQVDLERGLIGKNAEGGIVRQPMRQQTQSTQVELTPKVHVMSDAGQAGLPSGHGHRKYRRVATLFDLTVNISDITGPRVCHEQDVRYCLEHRWPKISRAQRLYREQRYTAVKPWRANCVMVLALAFSCLLTADTIHIKSNIVKSHIPIRALQSMDPLAGVMDYM